MSDKIKFPCCVYRKGYTEEQCNNLFEAFLSLGASVGEHWDVHSQYNYFGVDWDEETVKWDSVSDFSSNEDESEVTVYTYDQVMAFKASTEALQEESVSGDTVVEVEPLS